MVEFTGWMPLAQLNAPGTAPAPVAGTPAAPVVESGPAIGPAASGPAGATSAPGTQVAASQKAPESGFGLTQMLPIILMFVVLYLFLFRGQRKTEKKRKEMIAELKKGDRIMTIGGMLARVVSVDGDEVVLKIDESANVKAVYRKSSIQEVITDKE